MSINSFLCKHFDEEKKGYVNIGDIAIIPVNILLGVLQFIFSEYVLPILLIGSMIFVVVGTFSAVIQGFFPIEPTTLSEVIYAMLKGWIIPGIIIAISYITYKPAKYIMNLKIAKCPLKEKKEDD